MNQITEMWRRGVGDARGLVYNGQAVKHAWALVGVALFYTILVTLALSIISPSSAQPLSFVSRAMLLFLHIAAGISGLIVSSLISVKVNFKFPARIALIFITSPLFVAPVSYAVDRFFEVNEDADGAEGLWTQLAIESVEVAPTCFLLIAITLGLLWLQQIENAGEDQSAPKLQNLFPDIPRSIGNDLVRVSAEGHYVEVETTLGTALVYGTISDAVDRLEALEGWQVHRSHWVRANKVASLEKSGSAYECTLTTGTKVPVSRRRYSDIRRELKAETKSNLVSAHAPARAQE